MKQAQLILRKTANNQFTLPVLLNAIEQNEIHHEIQIKIIDSYSELIHSLSKMHNNVIAYSFMTSQLPETYHELIQLRQNIKENDLIICGGPHSTGDPKACLQMGFDIAFQGFAEKSFPTFLKDFLNNKHQKHLIIRETNPINLDESFPLAKRTHFAPPLEITRGCYNRCKFCQTGKTQNPEHRSMESVNAYLNELVERKYVTRAAFINPNGFEFGSQKPGSVNLDVIEALFALVRSYRFRHFDYGIFPAELNPKTVTANGLSLIKKYCTNKKITIGAQSGTTARMRKIGRSHTAEEIESTVALVNESGLRPQIDIILGFPHETEKDQTHTLNWMKRLHFQYNARFQVHYFLPLAGTEWADEIPSPIEQNIQESLIKFNKAGISTNWWQKGMQLSQSIIETKNKFR